MPRGGTGLMKPLCPFQPCLNLAWGGSSMEEKKDAIFNLILENDNKYDISSISMVIWTSKMNRIPLNKLRVSPSSDFSSRWYLSVANEVKWSGRGNGSRNPCWSSLHRCPTLFRRPLHQQQTNPTAPLREAQLNTNIILDYVFRRLHHRRYRYTNPHHTSLCRSRYMRMTWSLTRLKASRLARRRPSMSTMS